MTSFHCCAHAVAAYRQQNAQTHLFGATAGYFASGRCMQSGQFGASGLTIVPRRSGMLLIQQLAMGNPTYTTFCIARLVATAVSDGEGPRVLRHVLLHVQ